MMVPAVALCASLGHVGTRWILPVVPACLFYGRKSPAALSARTAKDVTFAVLNAFRAACGAAWKPHSVVFRTDSINLNSSAVLGRRRNFSGVC
jgi:hypothetical protein